MSLSEVEIYRVYKCDACKVELEYHEKVSDPWKKKCPICNKNKLYLDRANANMSVMPNFNKPMTVGSQGVKNYEEAKKRGTLPKELNNPTPFWRKGKQKINYKVLKNPEYYIKTGSTS